MSNERKKRKRKRNYRSYFFLVVKVGVVKEEKQNVKFSTTSTAVSD